MYCPKCGTQTVDQAAFCIGCGQNLSAPVVIVVSKPAPAPLPYGKPGRRVAALLVDLLIVLAPIIALAIAYSILSPDVADAETITNYDLEYSEDYSGLIVFIGTLSFLGPWFYFAGFESSRRRATPGKALMRLAVTNEEGSPVGFGRATARYFSKYVSASIMFVGFLMPLWSDRRQALHDIIARTLVLNAAPQQSVREASAHVLP